MFKEIWPRAWRPTPWRRRFARTLGGSGEEMPNLCHLVNPVAVQVLGGSRRFLCFMPGARWPGKRWRKLRVSIALACRAFGIGETC